LPIIIVGGSGKSVGKTALICGLISALPEFRWTAVKITSHRYGQLQSILEEPQAGSAIKPEKGTDTARYIAAGAHRSFLISCEQEEMPQVVREVLARLEPNASVLFESNRIVEFLKPDLCLGVIGKIDASTKDSFSKILRDADALVVSTDSIAQLDALAPGTPIFRLANLDSIPPEFSNWMRERLGHP
jgi:hypothetical protein